MSFVRMLRRAVADMAESAPGGGDLLEGSGRTYYWSANPELGAVQPGFRVPPMTPRTGPDRKRVEEIFERVRRRDWPSRPSRLTCIFVCGERKGPCGPYGGDIYVVEVKGKTFRTDGERYTEAVVEARRGGSDATLESWATSYWEGEDGWASYPEVLVDGVVTVIGPAK